MSVMTRRCSQDYYSLQCCCTSGHWPRDGHGLGSSMGWVGLGWVGSGWVGLGRVGSNFRAHAMGL